MGKVTQRTEKKQQKQTQQNYSFNGHSAFDHIGTNHIYANAPTDAVMRRGEKTYFPKKWETKQQNPQGQVVKLSTEKAILKGIQQIDDSVNGWQSANDPLHPQRQQGTTALTYANVNVETKVIREPNGKGGYKVISAYPVANGAHTRTWNEQDDVNVQGSLPPVSIPHPALPTNNNNSNNNSNNNINNNNNNSNGGIPSFLTGPSSVPPSTSGSGTSTGTGTGSSSASAPTT